MELTEWKGRWMDVYRWMDEWMDRWMDGWRMERMNRMEG